MSAHSQEGDCAAGLNPDVEEHQRQVLKALGKSKEEIEKIAGNVGSLAPVIQMRGRVGDAPAYIYTNPATLPDPKINLLTGTISPGFNLDGKIGAKDFKDPETNERGVDNMAYRALGCYDAQRAPPGHRPSFLSSSWDTVRDAMPAWLIEISDIDDPVNDPDVQIGVYQAVESMLRNPTTGDAQADVTYQISDNPRTQNIGRGQIKNGMLITQPFDLYMLGDTMYIPEYSFRQARLRLEVTPSSPERTVKGVLGGYHPWKTIYWGTCGNIALFCETTHSYDPSGIFYALSKLADAYPDPKTGDNSHISVSFSVDAAVAFVVRSKQALPQQAKADVK
jgi:hypothetical protein